MPRQRARFAAPRGLRQGDFRPLARHGIGDPENGLAVAGIQFRGRLYVSVVRRNAELCSLWQPPHCVVTICRQDSPPGARGPQLWRFDPDAPPDQRWYPALADELQPPLAALQSAEAGALCVFQGHADRDPALYAALNAAPHGAPALLRSEDGVRFDRVEASALAAEGVAGLGRLVAWGGRLFATASAEPRAGGRAPAVVYVSADPATGQWARASELGFGEPTNLAISALDGAGDYVYAATFNPVSGFELWRTRAEGEPPFAWQKVIERGAGRGSLNEAVTSLCAFEDCVYVGTGILHGSYDNIYHIGPTGAELLRVHPDGDWELVIGSLRPGTGARGAPLGGLGPGFESLFNTAVSCLTVHDGWLYAGTFNWAAFLPYLDETRWPRTFQRSVQKLGVQRLMKGRGGFDLWRSRDGACWTAVTLNGLGNPYNCAVSLLAPTSHGLVLGTANVFGPQVAVRVASGAWTYAFNAASGLELWTGSEHRTALADGAQPEPAQRPIAKDYKELMSQNPSATIVEGFFEHSGHHAWGLWTQRTRSQRQACEQLAATLLAPLPDTPLRVLEVGCGKGGISCWMQQHRARWRVVACDLTRADVEAFRSHAPGCPLLAARPTDLPFPEDAFDAVVCVDRASTLDTRERFLQEAFCVLRPGGQLAISDRLNDVAAARRLRSINRENELAGPAAYRALLERIGFESVSVRDIGQAEDEGYPEKLSAHLCEEVRQGRIDEETFNRCMAFVLSSLVLVKHYLLVNARKPPARIIHEDAPGYRQ